MRILEIRKLEDCLDGSSVHCYRCDSPWTHESILELGQMGALAYYPEFPRPFFRLRTARGMFVQGIAGEDTCRVVLPRDGQPEIRREWEEFFQNSPAF